MHTLIFISQHFYHIFNVKKKTSVGKVNLNKQIMSISLQYLINQINLRKSVIDNVQIIF